jgi:hypothetical protein
MRIMIRIGIGVLESTVFHFPQYCEGVLNLQLIMGAEESICYNNCTHNSPRRCVMIIMLFGEWNAGFQVSFPAYYHPPLLQPCLHAEQLPHHSTFNILSTDMDFLFSVSTTVAYNSLGFPTGPLIIL